MTMNRALRETGKNALAAGAGALASALIVSARNRKTTRFSKLPASQRNQVDSRLKEMLESIYASPRKLGPQATAPGLFGGKNPQAVGYAYKINGQGRIDSVKAIAEQLSAEFPHLRFTFNHAEGIAMAHGDELDHLNPGRARITDKTRAYDLRPGWVAEKRS